MIPSVLPYAALLTYAFAARDLPSEPSCVSSCVEGRLLPSLYLLGAQKAATTSLAHDLKESGITAAVQTSPPPVDITGGCWAGSRGSDGQGNCWQKEFHFW